MSNLVKGVGRSIDAVDKVNSTKDVMDDIKDKGNDKDDTDGSKESSNSSDVNNSSNNTNNSSNDRDGSNSSHGEKSDDKSKSESEQNEKKSEDEKKQDPKQQDPKSKSNDNSRDFSNGADINSLNQGAYSNGAAGENIGVVSDAMAAAMRANASKSGPSSNNPSPSGGGGKKNDKQKTKRRKKKKKSKKEEEDEDKNKKKKSDTAEEAGEDAAGEGGEAISTEGLEESVGDSIGEAVGGEAKNIGGDVLSQGAKGLADESIDVGAKKAAGKVATKTAIKDGAKSAAKAGGRTLFSAFRTLILDNILIAASVVGDAAAAAITAAIAIWPIILGVGVLAIILLGASNYANNRTLGWGDTDLIVSCDQELSDMDDITDEDLAGEVEGKRIENSHQIYSIFKSRGYSDIQIAALLGNLDVESGLDPTSVEGIYGNGNKYSVTTADKKEALADLPSYVDNTLFPMYDKNGTTYSPSAYVANQDGKRYPGIGMIQWTAGNAYNLIANAENLDHNWYDIDFQIAYMLANDAPTSHANFWDEFKNQDGDIETVTKWFAAEYEGNTTNGQTARITRAKLWYAAIQTYSVDEDYANSVFDMAESMGADSGDLTISETEDSCGGASDDAEGGGIHVDTGGLLDTIPMDKYRINQTFGNANGIYSSGTHDGIDMDNEDGDPIYAAGDGTVLYAGCNETDPIGDMCTYDGNAFGVGFGNMVLIEHSNGLRTIYGHMRDAPEVEIGDEVTSGTLLGYLGNTGNSTGSHFHFEVQVSDDGGSTWTPDNPDNYLPIYDNAYSGV